MKTFLFSMLFVLFLLVGCSDSGTNDDYNSGGEIWPLKLDNKWTYLKESEGFDVVLSISSGDVFYSWDGIDNSTRLWSDANKSDGSQSASIFNLYNKHLSKQTNGVYVGNYKSGKIQTEFFLPNQPVEGNDAYGNSWSKVASISTLNGTFNNCWKYTFSGMNGYVIFKKGVGVVYGNNFASNFSLRSYTLK